MREMVLEDPSLDTMDADADRKCVEFVQQMVRSRQTEAAEKVLAAYYQKKVARVGEGAPGLLPLVEAHVFLYKHKEDWTSMAAWAERALKMLRRLAGEGTVPPRQPRPLGRPGTLREMVEQADPFPRRASAKQPPAPRRKATPRARRRRWRSGSTTLRWQSRLRGAPRRPSAASRRPSPYRRTCAPRPPPRRAEPAGTPASAGQARGRGRAAVQTGSQRGRANRLPARPCKAAPSAAV